MDGWVYPAIDIPTTNHLASSHLLISSVSMLAPAAPTMVRISWSHAACSRELRV